MANSLGASFAASQDSFKRRVTTSLYKTAQAVLSETHANHSDRVPYAQQLIANNLGVISDAVQVIAALNASSIDVDADNWGLTDAQIDTAVSSAFNTLAGVDTGGTA